MVGEGWGFWEVVVFRVFVCFSVGRFWLVICCLFLILGSGVLGEGDISREKVVRIRMESFFVSYDWLNCLNRGRWIFVNFINWKIFLVCFIRGSWEGSFFEFYCGSFSFVFEEMSRDRKYYLSFISFYRLIWLYSFRI